MQPVSHATGRRQTPAPSGKYSGEPISVNLKDVDLRDFFRLIHEISGLNVVVDPSVKGTSRSFSTMYRGIRRSISC